MINKLKWILLLFVFPSVCYSNVPCNPSSWEDNLNEFSRLESKYNKHVKVFNALLVEHKQRPLLSKEFSPDELVMLWRVKSRRDMLQTQLDASIKYRQELTHKAGEITKLSTQSKWSANGWEKLAQSCKVADEMSNQITAEWYHSNATQLAEDYTKLSSLYLGLAAVYDREATALTSAKHKRNTNTVAQ
ncbi:ATPase [Vibrio sp. EA2]|uniref:ATPase n=1 Tax=Vibrio sp. EA2 TaxID=3079860 RepID=UPI00294A3A33|nr:ATPase [Vibrio sp. EA2]MDV6252397.1 ATPase [Vibrio sp. EA2]